MSALAVGAGVLTVDVERMELPETGIYVRAIKPGVEGDSGWGSHDIAHLDAPSLLAWLRSRGGRNQLAEDTVGALLGHDCLTAGDATADDEVTS